MKVPKMDSSFFFKIKARLSTARRRPSLSLSRYCRRPLYDATRDCAR